MKYAPISYGPKELDYFYKLPTEVQSEAIRLAIPYMNAIESVSCPVCKANDTKQYNGDNKTCVKCWYRYLTKVAKGVVANAGRSNKRD